MGGSGGRRGGGGRKREGGMNSKRKRGRKVEKKKTRKEEGEYFITVFEPYRQHCFMVDTLNSFITLLYSFMSQMMTMAPAYEKRTNLDNEL